MGIVAPLQHGIISVKGNHAKTAVINLKTPVSLPVLGDPMGQQTSYGAGMSNNSHLIHLQIPGLVQQHLCCFTHPLMKADKAFSLWKGISPPFFHEEGIFIWVLHANFIHGHPFHGSKVHFLQASHCLQTIFTEDSWKYQSSRIFSSFHATGNNLIRRYPCHGPSQSPSLLDALFAENSFCPAAHSIFQIMVGFTMSDEHDFHIDASS